MGFLKQIYYLVIYKILWLAATKRFQVASLIVNFILFVNSNEWTGINDPGAILTWTKARSCVAWFTYLYHFGSLTFGHILEWLILKVAFKVAFKVAINLPNLVSILYLVSEINKLWMIGLLRIFKPGCKSTVLPLYKILWLVLTNQRQFKFINTQFSTNLLIQTCREPSSWYTR